MQNIVNFLTRLAKMEEKTFVGRLGSDPEIKQVNTANGTQTVCNFSIGINDVGSTRDSQGDTLWLKIALWDDQVAMAQGFGKGDTVRASGRVTTSTWTGQDGQPRLDVHLKAISRVELVRKSQQAQQQPPAQGGWGVQPAAPAPAQGWAQPAPAPAPAPAAAADGGWGSGGGDDEIPF